MSTRRSSSVAPLPQLPARAAVGQGRPKSRGAEETYSYITEQLGALTERADAIAATFAARVHLRSMRAEKRHHCGAVCKVEREGLQRTRLPIRTRLYRLLRREVAKQYSRGADNKPSIIFEMQMVRSSNRRHNLDMRSRRI